MGGVLVIDGDDTRGGLVREAFQRAGFYAWEAADAGAGVHEVMTGSPCLIVVAQELAPLEDVKLLPLLRCLTYAPIIVIGAGDEVAVVRALYEGADAYVSLPLKPRILVARARALLRRYLDTRPWNFAPDADGEGQVVVRLSAAEVRALDAVLRAVVAGGVPAGMSGDGVGGGGPSPTHLDRVWRKLARALGGPLGSSGCAVAPEPE